MRPDGKFSLEEQVHKILYPLRTTSDDLEFGQQNLWLIDEKLTYHYHLASDTELSKLKVIDSASRNRPDILIFDRPAAFVEGDYPFQSVVIIELKRPQRNNYSGDDKDPCQQVYAYIEDILVFCPVSNFCIDELSKAYPHALEFMQCPLADASNRSI